MFRNGEVFRVRAVGPQDSQNSNTADYIAAHLKDLSSLARKENMTLLVYLLDMAQEESMLLAKQIKKTG